jgi:hypothetical protein
MTYGPAVKMRLLRSYRAYRPGAVIEVTGGLARTLELSGYAVRHEESPRFQFATAPAGDVERAEPPLAKARRKRHA